MKVYLIVLRGYDTHALMGIYNSRELAEKDLDFIGENENRRLACDERFQERWIKIEDQWHNQSRHKHTEDPWPSWEESDHIHTGDKISVEEHDVRDHSHQAKIDAVNAWQNNGMVHQLTCGVDSNHPNLKPELVNFNYDIGLVCLHPDCSYTQTFVPEVVYASYLSNRPQTS